MSKYFRFKKGSDAWGQLHKCFTYQDAWKANKEEIEKFLGFPMQDNLYLDVEVLTLNPKAVPEEWKSQFRLNSIPAVAKKNSKINKEWVALCNRLGLEVHKITYFAFAHGLYGAGTFYNMFGDYYYRSKREHDALRNEYLETIMEPISEVEFHELRAKHLKEEKAS